jgi:hypothetical protein
MSEKALDMSADAGVPSGGSRNEKPPIAGLAASRRRELFQILTKKETRYLTGDDGMPTNLDYKATGFGLSEDEATQILDFMPTTMDELRLFVKKNHCGLYWGRQQDALCDLVFAHASAVTKATEPEDFLLYSLPKNVFVTVCWLFAIGKR